MPMEKEGPGLWKELHNAGRRNLITPAWLHAFLLKLPCNQCKTDWVQLVRSNPRPPEESQFAWTVRMHNFVNDKIGKPIMSLEEAEAVHTLQPEIKPVELTLPTFYNISDSNTKAFWAFIGDMLKRGEKVVAEIRSTSGQIDMNTLANTGKDPNGNPTFGVGPQTKVALTVKMMIDVKVPAMPSL